MQKVRTQLFMNQLNDAETGNADTPEQIGATGGFPVVNEPVYLHFSNSKETRRAKHEHC